MIEREAEYVDKASAALRSAGIDHVVEQAKAVCTCGVRA